MIVRSGEWLSVCTGHLIQTISEVGVLEAVVQGTIFLELIAEREKRETEKILLRTYRNNFGMEFVLIPSGEFQMGSNNGDSDEKPVHPVRISKPFYMGKYEVTQAQWKAVMGDNLPVENVSWHDVQEFIRKLNAMSDKTYRLPTEAEWEYA